MVYTLIGLLFSLKKDRNPDICGNKDGSEGHAKWNKPDREEQILHDATYISNL